MLKKPKSTALRRSGPSIWPGAVLERTDSSTSSAFGPTNSRSRVMPLASPTAAPRTSYLIHVVRIRLLGFFGDGDGIVQRDHRRRVGIVGQEDGGEELVLRACPVERAAQGVAAADLLGRQPLHLAVGHVLDFLGGIAGSGGFVAKRRRPHGIGRHQLAVLRDRGLDGDDVACRRTESSCER